MYSQVPYLLLGRVAEVGRLSANAKNAFNSFVGCVFANLRQKNIVFAQITKIATKVWTKGRYLWFDGKTHS